MSLHHVCVCVWGGGGLLFFSTDPVGVGVLAGVGVAFCTHSISLMNG